MLRALFVVAIIGYGCAKSVKGPFYALLFYLWIAYFRPEYWLWSDFFSQLNLSFIVGIGVLVSFLLAPAERIRFGFGSLLVLLFLGQSFLSTSLSPYSAYAWPYFQDFLKSTVISLLIISLVNTEQRLRLALIVIVASAGFEGVKQGWAQLILNPGGQNTNEHAVFGDNNGVAIGMLMLSAMLVSLAGTAPTKWEKYFSRFALVGIVYRAVSTYSRGGFLSCGALAIQYLLRSRRKLAAIAGLAVIMLTIIPVLPQAFWDRMNTINRAQENLEETADDDASIRGRLHFWSIAWIMAKANPIVGVGHNAYNPAYADYDDSDGEWGTGRSVHSSWLGVLSELGFPGLFLFVFLIGRSFWTGLRVQRAAKRHPELQSLGKYALGLEGALITFCVSGTFVIFHYTEMLWHTLALSIALDLTMRERLKAIDSERPPATVVPAPVLGAVAAFGPGPFAIPAPVPLATGKPRG